MILSRLVRICKKKVELLDGHIRQSANRLSLSCPESGHGFDLLFTHTLLPRWGAVIFQGKNVLVQRRVGGQYPSYHPPTH